MAFCTNCGADVTGPFCGKCGAPAGAPPPAVSRPPQPSGTPIPPPAAAAPPTKTSPVVWIVVGCFGLLVVAGVIAVMGGYFVARKATQFAKNPGLAVSKMIAAANPDVEVVSTDEDTGRITVRDKKTGKTMTMNFSDAQKGRIVFKEDGKDAVTVEAGGEGSSAVFEMKSKDGSMKIGGGAPQNMPAWLPMYPGSPPEGAMSMNNANSNSGLFGFKTKDSVEQVLRYYSDSLKKAGLKAATQTMQQDGSTSGGTVTAEDSSGKRKASVTATTGDEGTSVAVTFESPK
jgi:hypothetical protein